MSFVYGPDLAPLTPAAHTGDASKTRPNVQKRLRYNKPAIAKFLAITALAGGVLTFEAVKGSQQSAQITEAHQLSQPAGEVAAKLASGEVDPNSVVAISAPTSDTPSGEASDLAKLKIIPSSARDEVAGIIGGQVGSPAQGTGIVLPKSDVDMNAIPDNLK